MRIDIISPGKFKEKPPYFKIFDYYKRRISLKINLIELKLHNFDKKKKNITRKARHHKTLKRYELFSYPR